MVVDAVECPPVDQIPDVVFGKKIVRESQFDSTRFVQRRHMGEAQSNLQGTEIVFELRQVTSSNERYDDARLLADPADRNLRRRATGSRCR